MSEHEEMLMCKTSIIIGKDTSQMKLNDIIEELVKVIEENYQNQVAKKLGNDCFSFSL